MDTLSFQVTAPRHNNLRRKHYRRLRQLKSIHALHSELAWKLDEVEQLLCELYEQRNGPTDIMLEREIKRLEQQRSSLEDSVLSEMLRIDELTEQVHQMQQEIDQAEAHCR